MLTAVEDHQQTNEFLLPHVPVDKRIIPNDMIRSSLFNVSNHNHKRQYLKEAKLSSFYSTEIIYTGEELRQDDEDVWLQLVYAAAGCQTDSIRFRPYSFMSQLGWAKRTQYRDRLKDSLIRMSATTLKLYNHDFKQGIGLSLIRKFEWSENGAKLKEWRVWLEPEIVKLFATLGRMYSKIHWQQRQSLKPLAKWLHAFYSSHSKPEPVHLIKLLQLSGSKMANLKHFKVIMRSSLTELYRIGFLSDFYIDLKNNVHVSRIKPLNLQAKYER